MKCGALYQHYKGGRYGGLYHFIGVATCESSGRRLVIYADPNGRLYSRPEGDFFSLVIHEGHAVPRFALVRE